MKNSSKYTNLSGDDIISLIKEMHNKTGVTPKRRDFKTAQYLKIREIFGSFSNAIKASGFKPRRVEKATEDELLESLRNYYNKHGFSPTTSTIDEELYSQHTYLKVLKCDGWSEVLKKAGLPVYIETRKGLPTGKKEIITYAKDLIKKENIKSMNVLLRHPLFYGKDRIDSLFGDTHFFAKRIGLEYNQYGVAFSDVEEKILAVAKELGRTPSIFELQSRGLSDLHMRKKFGTYNEVLEKIGIKPLHNKEIYELTNDELINIYKDISLKNGFENGCPVRQFKDLSDIGPDVLTGRFGSLNSLRKLCGFKAEKSRQTWDRDSVYSYLRRLTIKEKRKLTWPIINSSVGGPSATTIRRYLDKPFFAVASEIWDSIRIISE